MINVLVDYLTLSCRAFSVDDVFKKLKLAESDCTEIRSYYGLDTCYYYAGIKLHVSPEMLIVDMSGKGCRALESLHDKELNWIDFIYGFMCAEGSHMARLDIAIDDICENEDETPVLNMKTLFRKASEREYICKSRRMVYMQGDEEAVYFGSSKSDRRLRIYNKALERKVNHHWIRAEFQLRNDSALSFYMRAFETGDIGRTAGGMLFDYLRFTTDVNTQDHNQSRLNVSRFWIDFCRTTKKIPGFYIGGMEYNLDRLEQYISVQASSSLKTYLQLNEGDLSGLMSMVDAAKFSKKQKQLLDEYAIPLKIIEHERKLDEAPMPNLFGELPAAPAPELRADDDEPLSPRMLEKIRRIPSPEQIVRMYESGEQIDSIAHLVFTSGVFRFKHHARGHVERVINKSNPNNWKGRMRDALNFMGG